MNRTPSSSIKKSFFSVLSSLILTLSLVFLQQGFTYYVSFQLLALATVAVLICSESRTVKYEIHFLFAFLLFMFFVTSTAIISPLVISQNSSNIFLTLIGVLSYALMIGCLPFLIIKRPMLILHILKFVSSFTIFVLASLIALSESNVVPFLTRDSLLQQNSSLIDNFTDAKAILDEQALNLLIGQTARIDLFYGEPSFLAIVIFTCLGCFILTSQLLAYSARGSKFTDLQTSFNHYKPILLIGIVSMLYVQSFSSVIYALIVTYYGFVKIKINRTFHLSGFFVPIIITVVFLLFSYDYFLKRITQYDSLSFAQRFDFLLQLNVDQLLLGIKDQSILPTVGIHNGLFYIIAIAGFGGLLYLGSFFYTVFKLAAPIKMSFFIVLLLLSIMMQNGAVFSPSKVVLFSLPLLPLACARVIYSMNHQVSKTIC